MSAAADRAGILSVDKPTIHDEWVAEQAERLLLLLMAAPEWQGNYTTTGHVARFMLAEAERVGWRLEVGPR